MNRCRYFFYGLLPVFLTTVFSYGQGGQYHGGARLLGLGNASAALQDEWAAFHNVAGISGVEHPVVAFTYLHRYNIKALYSVAAVGILPLGKIGHVGMTVFRFGDKLYNEQKLSIGFANKIGFVRLGGQVHYLQVNVESLGREGLLIFDFGGIVELIPKLAFGARIFNATASVFNRFEQDYFPVCLSAGLSYTPASQIILSADIEKYSDLPVNIKSGIEYRLYQKISFRGGFNTQPSTFFFGIGFHAKRLGVDYACSNNHYLGYIHQVTASYKLKH
jgi:hypothetical protein